MANPRVLLMDEPSMGLAPALVQTNFQAVQQIHEEGVAIFMVEQNANMALSIADRGWVLQTGRVVLDDSAEALLANPELRQLSGRRQPLAEVAIGSVGPDRSTPTGSTSRRACGGAGARRLATMARLKAGPKASVSDCFGGMP